jgi:DNA-binding response OmpR family regulator
MKQDTLPIILLVELDDETRSLLKHNLQHGGYRVIVALDPEDAIERTYNTPKRPDIILLDQFGCSIEEFIMLGRFIRHGAAFPSHTPIVVIAERFGPEMEGKNIRVGKSEYVTYPEDGQQLMELLHDLCRAL